MNDLPEASPGPAKISKKERFATIVDGQKLLTIVAKFSLLDVCGVHDYSSACI